jgi:hypothetical protein
MTGGNTVGWFSPAVVRTHREHSNIYMMIEHYAFAPDALDVISNPGRRGSSPTTPDAAAERKEWMKMKSHQMAQTPPHRAWFSSRSARDLALARPANQEEAFALAMAHVERARSAFAFFKKAGTLANVGPDDVVVLMDEADPLAQAVAQLWKLPKASKVRDSFANVLRDTDSAEPDKHLAREYFWAVETGLLRSVIYRLRLAHRTWFAALGVLDPKYHAIFDDVAMPDGTYTVVVIANEFLTVLGARSL